MRFSHQLFKLKVKCKRYRHRASIKFRRAGPYRARMAQALHAKPLRVLVYGFVELGGDLLSDDEIELQAVGDRLPEAVDKPYDLFVVKSSGWKENVLLSAKLRGLAQVCAVWMYDNHHSFDKNYHLAAASDFYFPAHAYCIDYLKNPYSQLGCALPVACSQWPRREVVAQFAQCRNQERSDELYGGFVRYPGLGKKRNGLVEECLKSLPAMALEIHDLGSQQGYWQLDAAGRFRQWCSYKSSLALPIENDLGCRVFDALAAGQVPIVPQDVYDFDRVIAPDVQRELPIVRLEEYSAAAVEKAHREAVRRFDEEGAAGALRRHEYAVENHMEIHRLRQIISRLQEIV